MIEKKKKVSAHERVVLVAITTPYQNESDTTEFLTELAFLTHTAGGQVIKSFTQKLSSPHPGSFIGKGKAIEIASYVKAHNISMVIFDDELSATQVRNLEQIIGVRIIDRSGLILDIFATRARTAHAKTQVELAQYEYLLPRLAGMWTHLSRQKGGIGLRGPGETEIETDRRIVREKISLLKKKLKQIDKQKATQRSNRQHLIRVALVGYTNVGKSTFLNYLSKSEVLAENKLFATLDTTVRKVVIRNLPFLVSDTVGFIRKLPHQLIESFKSTLDETREADLLIHIIDISNQAFEKQKKVVQKTIQEITNSPKPTICIYNKIDAVNALEDENEFDYTGESEKFNLKAYEKQLKKIEDCFFVSIKEKKHTDQLKAFIYEKVKELHIKRYPYNHFLYQE